MRYNDTDVQDTIYSYCRNTCDSLTEHNMYSKWSSKFGCNRCRLILEEDLSIEGKLEFLDPEIMNYGHRAGIYSALTIDDIKGADARIDSERPVMT